jgi:hypothetical protein
MARYRTICRPMLGSGAQARPHDDAGLNFLLRAVQGVLQTFRAKALCFGDKEREKRQQFSFHTDVGPRPPPKTPLSVARSGLNSSGFFCACVQSIAAERYYGISAQSRHPELCCKPKAPSSCESCLILMTLFRRRPVIWVGTRVQSIAAWRFNPRPGIGSQRRTAFQGVPVTTIRDEPLFLEHGMRVQSGEGLFQPATP